MFRIVMIGPNKEQDYVEKMHPSGCPVLCGDDQTYAGKFPEKLATHLENHLRVRWLYPHIDVKLEPVT